MANVPHKALLASCEAIDKVHCHYSKDTKRKDDTENDRDKHESEHFTVLLSGVKILCWFPIISAVVTSYDRQRERFYPLSLFRDLVYQNLIYSTNSSVASEE